MRPLLLGLLTLGLLLGTPALVQAKKPKGPGKPSTKVNFAEQEQALLLIRRLRGGVQLSADDGDNDIDDHQGGRPIITTINLAGTLVTNQELDFLLRRTPGLENLYLSSTAIDNAGLAAIHDLPNLGLLDVSSTRITGAVTFNLGGVLPELVILNVSNTQTGSQNVSPSEFQPQKIPVVEAYYAANTQLHDVGVRDLQQGFPRLQIVDLSGCTHLTDTALRYCGQMPRLQLLSVARDAITDAGLANLTPAPSLQRLDLSHTQVNGSGLTSLASLPTLLGLALAGTPITDANLANVRSLRSLDALDLTGTAIGDTGVANLDGMPFLMWLNLAGTRITDGGIVQLRTLRRLHTLSLFNTQVGDGGMKELSRLRRLRLLDLGGTRITDRGLDLVVRLPDLEELSLLGTAITNRGLPLLRDAPSLRLVNVFGTRVTPLGVDLLRLEDPKLKVIF